MSGDALELAHALLARVPLIDGHNDLPAKLREVSGYAVDGLDSVRSDTDTDLVRLRSGRVGAQFWSAWVPSDIAEADAVAATLEQIDAVHRLVERYPEALGLAYTAAELEAEHARGRIASLIGIEGGHSIAGSPGVLRMFARMGVRYMTLTHNDDTAWAASATGARPEDGLSAEGEAVVREMNRIGMIVDLSHTSQATQLDAMRVSSAPVIFSHSSVWSTTEHPRNVTDRALLALATNGGVLQCTFVPDFVSAEVAAWERERRAACERFGVSADDETLPHGAPAWYPDAPRPGESAEGLAARNRAHGDRERAASPLDPAQLQGMREWHAQHPKPLATLAQVADHLDAARERVGIEHLGLGGDYDGTADFPLGLEDVSRYPMLFAALIERGWSPPDLERLASGNVLRVMREVEDRAETPLWPQAAR